MTRLCTDSHAKPRPCPELECRYHLSLDREKSAMGRFKLRVRGVAPNDGLPTCAWDVIEAAPQGLTQDEVADVMGCTGARIGQIVDKALRKLGLANPELGRMWRTGR